MTLVEIVIAMAILGIVSAVMVTACVAVNKMKISTSALNKRITYQSPIADNRLQGTGISNSIDTTDTFTDTSGGGSITYTNSAVLTVGGKKYKVYGNMYQVNEDLTYDDGTGTDTEYVNEYGEGAVVDVSTHNFKFFSTDTSKYTSAGTGSGLVVKLP